MRIAFDMVVVEQEYSAAYYAARLMLERLIKLRQGHQLLIVTSRPRDYAGHEGMIREEMTHVQLYPVHFQSRQTVLAQHQLLLPRVLRRMQPDLLHVPNLIAPIGWSGPLIVTAHHLPWLQDMHVSQTVHKLWRNLLHESMSRANHIITHSPLVRQELLTQWALKDERVKLLTAPEQAEMLLELYQETLTKKQLLSPYPKVSIVMPATRLHKAGQALQTIHQQDYKGVYETIVVGPVAQELERRHPVLPVHTPLVPPGKARNLGAAQATGEVLLFLDDDMLVTPQWITRNVHALQETQVGIVGAKMPGTSTKFFAHCVDYTNCGHYLHSRKRDTAVGAGSMAISHTLFAQLGGFDEELRSGEDIDLCLRLHRLGYRSVYQPDIVVLHDHSNTSFAQLVRYNYRHGLDGGLETKIRHRQGSFSNQLLWYVRFPLLFLILLPWIALCATLRITWLNIRDTKKVLYYMPFIFIGKLAYAVGIFMHLCRRSKQG